MQEEQNRELELVWEFVNRTSVNVFLTGKAGTGKTTFLKRVVEQCPKRKIVLAPTGVAAINAGGVTLHSFFQLPFGMFLPEFQHVQAHDRDGRYRFQKRKRKLIRSLELMIIDEVSMLRADIMDELDSILRKIRHSDKPFGGVQLLMIGDIQQLSPVVKDEEWEVMSRYYPSPYFFDAKVLRSNGFRCVELKKIYRQRDEAFIELLGAVRENRMTRELLQKLNSRYIPDYKAPDGCITLCSHNAEARSINDSRLKAIDSPEYTFHAEVSGNFPETMYPQDAELYLRKGAQVMFTKNDPDPEKLYVNGSLGVVTDISNDHITVRLDDGGDVDVKRLSWENIHYDINEETKEIVSEVDGLFTQYPLKTAWAITIHKSQGLTFDRVVIDAARSFSHGQVYVALSRCRSLEGIVLREKIGSTSIIKDSRVEEFCGHVSESVPDQADLESARKEYYTGVLKELFDMEQLRIAYFTFLKFARTVMPGLYPKALDLWTSSEKPFLEEISDVGERFCKSLDRIIGDDYLTSEYLQERLVKASAYFYGKAETVLLPLLAPSGRLDFDDQVKKKLFRQYFAAFCETLVMKMLLWKHISGGFVLEDYLDRKAVLSVEVSDSTLPKMLGLLVRAGKGPAKDVVETSDGEAVKESAAGKDSVSEDAGRNAAGRDRTDYIQGDDGLPEGLEDSELFRSLRVWRLSVAREQNIPAYCIMNQKTLMRIVMERPSTEAELLAVKGVGKTFISKYGEKVLELIRECK